MVKVIWFSPLGRWEVTFSGPIVNLWAGLLFHAGAARAMVRR
jgi:hypothetical protein